MFNIHVMKIIQLNTMWIDTTIQLPTQEGYYEVKFDDGTTDEKPFRIRPSKNIHGFMTMKNVTHWRPIATKPYFEID